MKKLFLTSGIIACMACPAFAAGFTTSEISGGTVDQNTNEITIQNACVSDQIGVTTGDTTLDAQWVDNFRQINLVTNTAANGWDGSSRVSQTPVYSVPRDSDHIYTMGNDGNMTAFDNYDIGNGTNGFTPLGKTVTMTWAPNLPTVTAPTGQQATQYTTSSTELSNWSVTDAVNNTTTTPNRTFNGFWSDATEGTQYIGANGAVLTAGKTAAAGYTADSDPNNAITWYAQYDCATAPSFTPSLTGYDFSGWVNPSSGAPVTNFCITDNTTVQASWTPHTGSITYNCGADANGRVGTATVGGSTNNINVASITYDTPFSIATTPDTCSVPGYTFAGWDCNYNLADGTASASGTITYAANSNGVIPTTEGVYKVAANGAAVTCTAKWTKNSISITWTDSATNTNYTTQTNNSCTYDEEVVLPANPTRTGYTFNGWLVDNTPAQP